MMKILLGVVILYLLRYKTVGLRENFSFKTFQENSSEMSIYSSSFLDHSLIVANQCFVVMANS